MRDAAIANDIMLRQVMDTMILSPPLIWDREIIDLAVSRVRKAFDEATVALG